MQARTEAETATVGAFKAVSDFLSEKIRWADNALKLSSDEKFGDSEAESKREFDSFIRDGRLMGIVFESYDMANHFGLDLGICKACYDDEGELVPAHKAHKNDFTAHTQKTLAELSAYLQAAIEVADATIVELEEHLDNMEGDEWSECIMDIETATGNGAVDYQVLKLLSIKPEMCEHCMARQDEIWNEITLPSKKKKGKESTPKDDKKSGDELPMAYR